MNNLLPNPFSNAQESTMSTGGYQETPTDSPVGSRVDVGAFDNRFVLDEAAFLEAIEQPPAFLASPGLPYLAIVEVLAGR